MERRTVIGVAAASAGVLIAGTVAGLAVVNASGGPSTSDTSSLTLAEPSPDATVLTPLDTATTDEPLPSIVVPAVEEASVRALTRKQAEDVVASATEGTVLGATATTHRGYDAYAVQVERPDGSIVTALVESTSGVIYDWTLDRPAPPAPTYTDDDDDHAEQGDKHGEDHEQHGDDHEGDDDDD